MVLSFTNKAIQNVKQRAYIRLAPCKENTYFIYFVGQNIYTFDSYFCEWNDNINNIKDKTVFIDEFSMVPNEFITVLYKLWLKYNFKLFMFADLDQCNLVTGGSQIYYDYINSVSVRQMCPKLETLEYVRYVSKLKKTNNGKGIFNPITKSYKNICYLNKT